MESTMELHPAPPFLPPTPPEALEVARWLKYGRFGFDQFVGGRATMADLDLSCLRRFWLAPHDDDHWTLARKLGMARAEGGGELLPTTMGLLFAARDSHERFLPNAFIRAEAYRGRPGPDHDAANYLREARDLLGPLDVQVEEACRFVDRNQSVFANGTGGRREIPQYDLESVLEGIVNAVAHRDYAIYDRSIRLRMYSDRLVLESPGAIAEWIPLPLLEYRRHDRNRTIVSMLGKCPVPDGIPGLSTPRETMMDLRLGGVGLLLRKSEEHSGRRPKYELVEHDTALRLTIYAASPESGNA